MLNIYKNMCVFDSLRTIYKANLNIPIFQRRKAKMKKNLVKSLICCTVLSLTLGLGLSISAGAAETTDLFSEDYLNTPSGGSWEWVDGTLVAKNADIGDTAMMTDVFVEPGEHIVIEATGVVDSGSAWGIILAEVDPSAPFASWICLNMDLSRPSTRLFGPNVANPNEAELRNPDFVTGQPYTLALEVNEDGEFHVYFNGEEYGVRQNDSYIGGYVGLMTWNSDTTFSSLKISYLGVGESYEPEQIEMVIVEQPYDVRTMTLGAETDLLNADSFKTTVNGEFNWSDGKLIAPNASLGDCAYMTDYFVDVDDHVYIEVTGNVTEGQAFGIMMAKNSYETPFDSWMCMNMEIGRPSTRLFGPGFAKEIQLYSDDFTNNKPLTIGVEIDAGTFYLYSNGEFFGQIENTEWNGCYLGLMTWTGSCEFTEFKVCEVDSAEQYTVYPDGAAPEEPAAEAEASPETSAENTADEPEKDNVETAVTEPETEAAPADVTSAPQTFDFTIIAAVSAVISGAALSISKKRK